MKKLSRGTALAVAAVLGINAAPAIAGPGHSAAGEPGKAANASEHVTVVARETDDGRMIFEPSKIEVAKGTTVEIVLDNKGQIEHELSLGTPEEIQ